MGIHSQDGYTNPRVNFTLNAKTIQTDRELTVNHRQTDIEAQLLDITKQLLIELKQERAIRAMSIDADLEHKLGIGSLEKAELFRRVEKQFDVQLEESLITEGETLRDLITAITTANPYIKHTPTESYPELPELNLNLNKAKTLVEVLQLYATQEPDRPHIYLQNEHGQEKIISYGKLYHEALAVAKGLKQHGLEPKQTVAIMLPSCEEFFYSFFGILLAGGIPVPIYPPFRASKLEEYIKREASILNNAQSHTMITFTEVEKLGAMLKSFVPSLKNITTVKKLMAQQHPDNLNVTVASDDGALIQYTSGSTGDPKGVLLSHQNLISNIVAIAEAIDLKPTDVIVSWLPLYHDMGLIGTWLGSMYHGIPITIMSPLTFLTHPEKWLWAMHYHRATLSAAPNFAYELCLSKIDDKALEGLDLSSWRIAFNGAEAVYPSTIRRFQEKFAKYGLRESALCPVYGLAENCVGVSISDVHAKAKIDRIDRETFEKDQCAVEQKDPKAQTLEFACCGKILPGHKMKVVDDNNKVVPDRVVGHLQFQGPSMMQGYYNRPEATAAIMRDGWYDTGDFAYMVDDEVYITGREKDVIIKAGRNLYPQEIEEIVGNIEKVRKGCVVAFGDRNDKKGTEKFVIVAESREHDKDVQTKLHDDIIEHVAANMGLPPDDVLIVPPGTILKTSSGKLQRSATKKAYLEGKLVKKIIPVKMQVAKMIVKSISAKITRSITRSLRFIYSVYLMTFAILTLVPMAPIIRVLSPQTARRVVKGWCRVFLLMAGCPVQINNSQIVRKKHPLIYVANHASYMDSVLLIAALPTDVLFVAKKEINDTFLISTYAKACGYLTVDRMDFSKSLQDAEIIKSTLQSGMSIMIFPEGTFAYATGVRPFKLGAFNLATESGESLCTIGLRGTRPFLRANTMLFMPARLSVNFGDIVKVEGNDFQEAIRLRDETRQQISQLCDEKPINMVRAGPDEVKDKD